MRYMVQHSKFIMKNYDIKHILYHVLVAIYFIWVPVFAVLLGMSVKSSFDGAGVQLIKILLVWIMVNLVMGTALFVVMQQFHKKTILSRIIFYSYFILAAASVTTVLIIIP
jgi:hypothetical protein